MTANSMDSVADRDFVIELLGAISILMMHLSRFSEEIILWSSGEFGFITLDERVFHRLVPHAAKERTRT